MPENMIQQMQKTMKVHIEKIDPSDEALRMPLQPERVDFIAQATIPATLIATLERLNRMNTAERSKVSCIDKGLAFNDKQAPIITAIAQYSQTDELLAEGFLEQSLDALNALFQKKYSADAVAFYKDLYEGQHLILAYLPLPLELGKILSIEAIDQKENKLKSMLEEIADYFFKEK